jgi:hypothetical protein
MTVFKNEKIYLKEWIDFHLKSGIDHFYLFDNMSTDNPIEVLKSYIEKNIVTLELLDKDLIKNPECEPHRNYFKEKYGKENEWVLFIDLDEYCYPLKGNNIQEYINKLNKNISCVVLPMINFGYNNKMFYEEKPTIERFTKRGKIGCIHKSPCQYKSMVKINDVKKFITSHKTIVNNETIYESLHLVNEKFRTKSNLNKRYEPKNLRLNHYWCRSKEEFLNIKNHYYPKDKVEKKFNEWNKGCNTIQDFSAINFFNK